VCNAFGFRLLTAVRYAAPAGVEGLEVTQLVRAHWIGAKEASPTVMGYCAAGYYGVNNRQQLQDAIEGRRGLRLVAPR